ncbi:MAG: hypothetical protein KGH72_05745 [Candidatus Micrarchaeota archaeon]|nr:hypothetical protein [Candidatus Micrarchaeota archaeon]
MDAENGKWKIPFYLLLGFAVSSIGGPLALASVFIESNSGGATKGLVPMALIAIALFSTVIIAWRRYSDKVASSGGLYSFVRYAAGERAAKLQGYIWMLSYFLYLPYTVTYLVFYALPAIFSIPNQYLYILEIAMPVAISAVMFSRRLPFYLMLLLAIVQSGLVLAFSGVVLGNTGFNPGSLAPAMPLSGIGLTSASLALLFICADLPIFLGGEAEGGGKAIKKVLLASFAIVAALVLVASLAISNLPRGLTNSDVFGFGVSQAYAPGMFAYAIGTFTVLSVVGLIMAEFVGLSRLMHAMFRMPVPRAVIYISIAFVAFDIVSLLNPTSFYDYLIVPSIGALFLSQLIVFVVYPVFVARSRRISALDIVVTVVTCLLMAYGLYGVVSNPFGYFLS